MKVKNKVIQVQQDDKDIPIEFLRIESIVDLFDFDQHYQYDFYQIYWFTEASNQQHEIDFIAYPIESNQIWIIYPGQVHYLNPIAVKGYCLAIDKDYFHRVLFQEAKQQGFMGSGHLKFDVVEPMQQLFEHLHVLMEMEFNLHRRSIVLEKYVQLYIIHLQDLPVVSQQHIAIDARIHKLLELIDAHYITQRRNEFYADKVALSTKRMNQVLQQSLGMSLKQQLQSRLLLEAKRLVGYSNDNIQDIAHKLQFSDVSYFNRFFKKLTQQTPKNFRALTKKVQE